MLKRTKYDTSAVCDVLCHGAYAVLENVTEISDRICILRYKWHKSHFTAHGV